MRTLQTVEVHGLFGYVDHTINVRQDGPTIITAPNGAGKTHLLNIAKHALGLDIDRLAAIPFRAAHFYFSSGESLAVEREANPGEYGALSFSLQVGGKTVEGPTRYPATRTEEQPGIPAHLEERPDGSWYDLRNGRVVTRRYVESAYNIKTPEPRSARFRETPRILEMSDALRPILIDTKRLDAPKPNDRRNWRESDPSAVVAGRIQRYVLRIGAEVVQARRNSIRATQRSDVSFAMRALAVASETIRETELHARYDRIVESYERLSKNGLAIGEELPPFPEKTTPTVRRILSPFLDDWEARLQPLLPLNEKLETLRGILDAKLRESGKRTTIDGDGRLGFESVSGRKIRVASLSSGEQHLVALFTELLFTAAQGSVVLIDEPEISMHAAWQHAFLEDITRVSSVANHQVILATHSPAIVNGRWDLEEPLTLTLPPENSSGDLDESELELEELLGGLE